jgi:hypothetical protein
MLLGLAFAYMTDRNDEQAMLWRAAIKEIGRRLQRELLPEEQTPERLRELLAQLDASGKRKSEE